MRTTERQMRVHVFYLCWATTLLSFGTIAASNAHGNAWSRTFESSAIPYDVEQTSDGGYVLVAGSELLKTDAEGNLLWRPYFHLAAFRSVEQTADGGYIVAGSSPQSNAYLVKTDGDGNSLWERTFGGYVYTVHQTSEGGYLLAGYSAGGDASDGYLVKTDAEGNLLWQRTFDRSEERSEEAIYAVQQTSDGGYFLAGSAWSNIGQPGGAYLVKTDADGNLLWQKTLTGLGGGRSIEPTADGSFVFGGATRSSPDSDVRSYLLKVDAEGNMVWYKALFETIFTEANPVWQSSDGGFVLGGGTSVAKTDAAGNMLWKRSFGGGSEAYSVRQTLDGGYIVAGRNGRIFLAKLAAGPEGVADEVGMVLWQRNFGGGGFDQADSVQQTSDLGYILGGSTRSFGSGAQQGYLVKTDICGNLVWQRNLGQEHAYVAGPVLEASGGGYVLTGYGLFMLKTDANGVTLWEAPFSGNVGVEHTAEGGYALLDYTFQSGGWEGVYYSYWMGSLIRTDSEGNQLSVKDFYPRSDWINSFAFTLGDGYVISGRAGGDAYLARLDQDGVLVWERVFGGNGAEVAYSAHQTTDGGFILAGSTWSLGAGFDDAYLVKTDADGNLLWERVFGGTSEDRAYSVIQTSDGGYLLAGETWSFGAGGNDAYLVKTDAEGNLQWQRAIGGPNGDVAKSVVETPDGKYVLAGYSYNFSLGNADAWLVKFDPAGQEIEGEGEAESERDVERESEMIELEEGLDLEFGDGETENGREGEIEEAELFDDLPCCEPTEDREEQFEFDMDDREEPLDIDPELREDELEPENVGDGETEREGEAPTPTPTIPTISLCPFSRLTASTALAGKVEWLRDWREGLLETKIGETIAAAYYGRK